jgi:hypothetical protein
VTLVEVAAAVVIVLMAGAIFLPVLGASSRSSKVEACGSNLKALYQAAAAEPVGPEGRAYWTRFSPARIAASTLRCPMAAKPAAPECDYLGPAKVESRLEGESPLGCDARGNHDRDDRHGGNVLLRNGRIVVDHTNLWAAAIHGACRP